MKRASLENRGGKEGESHPHQGSLQCVFPVVRHSAHRRLLSLNNFLLLLRVNKHAPPCSHRQQANTYLAAANLDLVSAGNQATPTPSQSLSLSLSVHLTSSLPSPHLSPLPVCLPPAGSFLPEGSKVNI